MLVTKWVGFCRLWQFAEAKWFTEKNTPELLHAYAAFATSSQSGSPRQPFKGRDLWRLLNETSPKSIAEMGSGTTSAVFALWAKRHGARYVCYEHHEGWAQVTTACLDQAGLSHEAASIRCVPSRATLSSNSTGFVEDLPADVEFVYVDGPPCSLERGVKVPNDDVSRLLDAGGRPRAIVVDGRIETVDLIRNHPAMRGYRFLPSLVYCLRRKLWGEALSGREHTVFLRGAR